MNVTLQRYSAWVLLTLFAWQPVPAAAESESAAKLFQDASDNAPLQLKLSGPLAALARDSSSDPERRAGVLTVVTTNRQYAIQLQPRGKSRRKSSNCRFPPLWLRFDKDEIKGTRFEGHHRRKLVTHCSSLKRKTQAPSKLWLEFLAYRTLNLLTDRSFRVHPLLIRYVDSAGGDAEYEHPGFLIEHKKELARRLGAEVVRGPKVPRSELDLEYGALASLFNLLIGNPDFSLARGPAGDDCCHNSVPLRTSAGRVTSIPYDFDNTGLVSPRYAQPPQALKIRSVRTRSYRGYCRFNDALSNAAARIEAKREAILALYRTGYGLSDRERARALKYIEQFFERYPSQDGLKKLRADCLG